MHDESASAQVSGRTLESLVERAADGVLLVDREHRVAYRNHRARLLDPELTLGQSVGGFAGQADRARLLEAIDRTFETHDSICLEFERPGEATQQLRRHHARVTWVPTDSGSALVSMTVTDLTESQRSEAAGLSEHNFLDLMNRIHHRIASAATIDSLLDATLEEMLDIFRCDRAWLLYPCDPAASTWTVKKEKTRARWPGAARAGMPIARSEFSSFVFETARSAHGAHVFDPSHNALDPENALVQRFGIRSQMLMEIRPRLGDSWCLGLHHCEEARVYTWEIALFEAIGRRIADALTALLSQQDLRESEARFRTLMQHATEAIVIFDLDERRFVLANDHAYQLFGFDADEFMHLGVVDISPPLQPGGGRSADLIREHVEEAIRGGIPAFEWLHVDSAGKEIPCEVRLVRLPSEGRRLIRGSITDIRARKAAEQEKKHLEAELAQAHKMEAIGQLTGGVAHDFNNLLTVMLGSLEIVLTGLASDDPGRELLEKADEAGRRAAELTQRLLAFSRKQALQPQVLNLNSLLVDLGGMLQRVIGETIEIEVIEGQDLWNCEADPSQLENAILNLAINARDAMPRGGALTFETANADLDGQSVKLVVTDNGTGMPAEVRERAFDPFFTTKVTGKGSGLGLSMVFGFVKQSGGHVQIESEVGVGTSVSIHLPRSHAEKSTATAERRTLPDSVGTGEIILVVEDSEAVREFTVEMLERLGYRTIAVEDGRQALEELESGRAVDLLFTDVVLPGGMNGAEVAQAARVLRPDLKVLFTSGYTEDVLSQGGRLAPKIELLPKPFRGSDLARSIHAALKASDEE